MKRTIYALLYHYYPDEEDSVADQDDEARNLIHKVPLTLTKQGTVLHLQVAVGSLVIVGPQHQPQQHVQNRGPLTIAYTYTRVEV